MPRFLFRQGVDICIKNNDIIITTPYATRSDPNRQLLRISDAEEPIKKLVKKLSQEGIESNQYRDIPKEIGSTSPHFKPWRQLKDFYRKGLLIHEISGCNGIAMRLLPINPGIKQQLCPSDNKEIKLSTFTSIQPCLEGLDITSPLTPTTLRLQDHRLYPLIQRLVAPCTLESIRLLLPEDLRSQSQDIISLFLSSGMAGICNSEQNAEIYQ